jgi:hypothetical protein
LSLIAIYASVDDYFNEVHDTAGKNPEAAERSLESASRLLDIEAWQCFGRDDAVTARTFVGDDTKLLRLTQYGLPGLATLCGVVVKIDTNDDGDFSDETALDNSALRFFGRYGSLIELTSRAVYSYFPSNHLVQVTGDFGWPSTPKLVERLTIITASIDQGKSPLFSGQHSELDVVANVSPMAGQLVKRFRAAYALPAVG